MFKSVPKRQELGHAKAEPLHAREQPPTLWSSMGWNHPEATGSLENFFFEKSFVFFVPSIFYAKEHLGKKT